MIMPVRCSTTKNRRIGSRIVSQLVISVVQAIILVGVGMLLFDLEVTGSLLAVFFMVILGSLAFQSLGFVISAFAKNQEAADSIANAVSFPMLFLSGVFFPVDSAPAFLQPIMKLMPLRYGETYLLVAKIAASAHNPDQVFLRVYGPGEPIEPDEPAAWSAVSPELRSDLVFDWLQLHVNSTARQTIDEIRLGTTWASVAAPWMASAPGKEGHPN